MYINNLKLLFIMLLIDVIYIQAMGHKNRSPNFLEQKGIDITADKLTYGLLLTNEQKEKIFLLYLNYYNEACKQNSNTDKFFLLKQRYLFYNELEKQVKKMLTDNQEIYIENFIK